MAVTSTDRQYMAQALRLAAKGRYTTDPNPNVGAVIVQSGTVVGEGYHHQAGDGHAEVYALAQAGARAMGATCYVTLEPCSHFGRTPPCATALVAAGISRVVIAMLDPNPLVAGKGVAMLEQAGIDVVSGVMEAEARALNPGFLSVMERQKPWLRLKLAASIDGRTALANGQSQWITGPAARADVQFYRAQSSAILSTASTVLADNARLTVRQPDSDVAITALKNGELRQPLRVILDRRQQLTGRELLFSSAGPVLLCVAPDTPLRNMPSQVEHQVVPVNADGYFDLMALLQLLTVRQVRSIWVEAGATLAGALLQQKLVDEFILYQAPLLLGPQARAMAELPELTKLSQANRFTFTDISQLAPDLRLTALLSGADRV
ncbi:bifunctional diaminohydroxyphosphoribosylaminopyrimidine deaminase/5-amino-6-(5-phosphoribosylamino)uracil reductase RibD [Arsukibacterium sp.]|uniref:bifunctional diaminohydroxyphosphoribosylaminopyrimidine deaminase/5-amino-6-(5-phosphoribosylamino)uracil reductase RibD n=1 Tax=Arsukibacterium sp. TaxID=1977258 RepID=UPI00299E9533|nr:bifunctional diaminohydroxyphosphoribosylaminopyrimidine deaminase/5-amino-6-(5-phosphoribosylamino)uracil reductase RibD [Arsukibacterium sp.]MDX1678803.1 bifunctional diaminohydroxyphosphoribosylaminopyrimidine deaminase/5-amino-6-(5-phosphoribosylamino)uracil reductase RibD [Arsukibacterium sp.]